MTDGAIIVGGEKHVIPGVEVHTWHDTGLLFDTSNSAEIRHTPPKWFVVHWTASEREGLEGARAMHRSMLARRIPLSVEFMITNEGTIWQFADPADVRCRHASRLNDRSVGVEVSGKGWKRPGRTVSGATINRRQYRAELPGWRPTFFDFFDEQHRALAGLADVLTSALPIPRTVIGKPWSRRPRGFFDEYPGGICGHIHCAHLSSKNPKCDPGPAPLERLARYFADQHQQQSGT